MKTRTALPLTALAMTACLTAIPEASAGGGGAEFQAVYDTLTDWTEGVLGKIVTIALIIAGIGIGIARQSIAAFGIGIASALGFANAPTIVDNIVTASLPVQAVMPADQMPAVMAVLHVAGQ